MFWLQCLSFSMVTRATNKKQENPACIKTYRSIVQKQYSKCVCGEKYCVWFALRCSCSSTGEVKVTGLISTEHIQISVENDASCCMKVCAKCINGSLRNESNLKLYFAFHLRLLLNKEVKGRIQAGGIRDYQSRIWTWVVRTKTLLCTILEPFHNQSDCKSAYKNRHVFCPHHNVLFFYTHLVIAWSLKNKTWLFSFSRTHKKIFRFFLVHTIVCTHIIYITNTNKLILAPSAKSTVSFFFCPIGSFIISICSYFQGEKVCSHNLWNYKQEYLCLRSAFFPRLFCSSVINNIFWLLVVNYVKLQRGQCRNRQLFWAYELNFF